MQQELYTSTINEQLGEANRHHPHAPMSHAPVIQAQHHDAAVHSLTILRSVSLVYLGCRQSLTICIDFRTQQNALCCYSSLYGGNHCLCCHFHALPRQFSTLLSCHHKSMKMYGPCKDSISFAHGHLNTAPQQIYSRD